MEQAQDVYEPLKEFVDKYRKAFLDNEKAAFEDFTKQANVDVNENKKTCAEIYSMSDQKKWLESKLRWRKIFRYILVLAAICLPILVFAYWDSLSINDKYIIYVSVASAFPPLIIVLFVLNPKITSLQIEIADLDIVIKHKTDDAWEQMKPLNSLFGWDIAAKLIQKTVPRLHFDPYFSEERLAELESDFGYDEVLEENSSVLFSQSGEISGNPFVICSTKNFTMGSKSYSGYKTIYWTTSYRGSDGKWHRMPHSQTLCATVTKPYPEYYDKKFVLFGNLAAPNLTFSRSPSKLVDEGRAADWKRKMKLKELTKFSQNLKDESNYTLMSNHEFETLFQTTDRNDEVEYRLLFTPIAQQQMVSLIKDKLNSFGDDFYFFKSKKLNFILSKYLDELNLDTDPSQFYNFDYNKIKLNFDITMQNYFRKIYFALAPLLSIPIYQQTRTLKTIYGDDYVKKSARFEWESLANYFGVNRFKAANCATDCILKTERYSENSVKVYAHGFSGHNRVDHIRVFGGDGRYHMVPVEWVEYKPVVKETKMSVKENPKVGEGLTTNANQISSKNEIFRRGIFSKVAGI